MVKSVIRIEIRRMAVTVWRIITITDVLVPRENRSYCTVEDNGTRPVATEVRLALTKRRRPKIDNHWLRNRDNAVVEYDVMISVQGQDTTIIQPNSIDRDVASVGPRCARGHYHITRSARSETTTLTTYPLPLPIVTLVGSRSRCRLAGRRG